MADRIETVVLRELCRNTDYVQRVLPYIQPEYFQDEGERDVFCTIRDFILKYNSNPTYEALRINFGRREMAQDSLDYRISVVDELEKPEALPHIDWLVDSTEKFCQEEKIHDTVLKILEILDDKSGKKPRGGIPQMMEDALSVSFDPQVGHDYFEDAEARYEFYHRQEERIPFDLIKFNEATKGGVPRKTLNVVMAGPGVGKSLFLCHHAAHCLKSGKQVVYITLEMAQERICERIDENLLRVNQDDLGAMTRENFLRRIQQIKNRTIGRLFVKEYASGSAHAGHFRHYLNELRLKKHFKPDVLFIDYINICASARVKQSDSGLYGYVKSIAEELRGLGQEYNIPVWSATQINRGGHGSTTIDMDDVADSWGLPMTVDFLFGLMEPEEMKEHNQFLVNIIKNRYNDKNKCPGFGIGTDKSMMTLMDLEGGAQENIHGSKEANDVSRARREHYLDKAKTSGLKF